MNLADRWKSPLALNSQACCLLVPMCHINFRLSLACIDAIIAVSYSRQASESHFHHVVHSLILNFIFPGFCSTVMAERLPPTPNPRFSMMCLVLRLTPCPPQPHPPPSPPPSTVAPPCPRATTTITSLAVAPRTTILDTTLLAAMERPRPCSMGLRYAWTSTRPYNASRTSTTSYKTEVFHTLTMH